MRVSLVPLVALLVLVMPSTARAVDPYQELNLIRPVKRPVAQEFTVASLNGGPLSLRDHRGAVIFLNFWATWCPPCKEEMPAMERLYRRFRARGFTVLAISIDTGDSSKVGLTFPVGLDPRLEVASRYTVAALPASFIIDRSGHVVAVALGARDWDGRSAHALIEALLKP